MICSKCGKNSYRTFSYIKDGKMYSNECEECYPEGGTNSWSKKDLLRSRTLAPDGRTVLTGQAGLRMRDTKLKRSRP
jgi:hypothetical protein